MNLNKALIIGNLTRDPELRSLPSGQAVTTFGVATNRVWKNQQGEKQQSSEFHNIVLFGRLAEIANQYLSKGSMVFIEGRMQTRTWQSQYGSKRNRTEIVAERLQLGPRKFGERKSDVLPEGTVSRADNIETVEYPQEENINPDEIPF